MKPNRVELYTFSLQYPNILFPGKTQFSTDAPPKDLSIHVKINSIHPLNWIKVGREIKNKRPDMVIIRYWLPFMAPSLGTIARIIKKNKHTKVLCLVDNLIPHEARIGDKQLTKYFVKPMDGFITMSETVRKDTEHVTNRPVMLQEHPLIDNFGAPITKQEAQQHLKLVQGKKYILFFGFIRKYKGLDLLLEAIKILKEKYRDNTPTLIVAGEFYEDADKYHQMIDRWDIADKLILHTDFIPNSAVKYYLSACDFLMQPYRDATQSGVTPLAYHFEKPMLVTNVGGLSDIVPDGVTGVVVQPDASSIAAGIERLYQLNENHLIENVRKEKMKYSWEAFTKVIYQLAEVNK